MLKNAIIGATLLVTPLFGSVLAEVHVQPSETVIDNSYEVLAGNSVHYKMRLVKGTAIHVKLSVSGGLNDKIKTWLVDLENYQRFAAGQRYSYFQNTSGDVTQKSTYTFEAPSTNIYYLILDNRAAMMAPRQVTTKIYKIHPTPTESSIADQKYYTGLYSSILKDLFEFPDFNVHIGMCGMENAFSTPDIVMCRELEERFHKDKVPGASLFVFLHEAGHSLFHLWGFPLASNEDVADEFSTFVMLILQREDELLQAAQWWGQKSSEYEAISSLYTNDRHTISPQRGRNIVNWIDDKDDLVERWIRLLIPKLSDKTLQLLKKDTHETDVDDLVRREISERKAAGR